MVFWATFNNLQVFSGGKFYWRRKPEYLEKTTFMSQVTNKLYEIKLYLVHFAISEIWTTLVVLGTDWTCSKSNYCTVTTVLLLFWSGYLVDYISRAYSKIPYRFRHWTMSVKLITSSVTYYLKLKSSLHAYHDRQN